MDYQTAREVLKNESLPAALVDLEAFDANIEKAAHMVRDTGKTIRIATKSLRVPALIQRVVDYGPPYQGLMCYSAQEAKYLADEGFDDILVAYPTVQDKDVEALVAVHAGKTVRLVVDSVHQLSLLSQKLGTLERPFEVLLDIDLSLRFFGLHLGVRRSPLRTAEDVTGLAEEAKKFSNLQIVGLMGYEAQVAGVGDQNPFKRLLNPAVKLVRALSVRSAASRREKFAAALGQTKIFNGGGTGSLNYSIKEKVLTEVTIGSAFLSSHLFDYYSNIRFQPAAYFALQVVRSSDSDFVTCQGGGYIASGEAGWDKVPRPWMPTGAALVSAEGCGEVQTPLQLAGESTQLRTGDPVLFRHAKAGELAERFNEYLLVDGGRVVTRAPTYRGAGKCFF